MHPVIVDGSSTQVSHGETAAETGAMLGMNAHALGVRHDLILGEGNAFMRDVKRGIDAYLAATRDGRQVPVVNLQCDVDHPTQTLADLCWLREKFPEGLAGKRIAVSWAYSPSYAKPLSVPQGLIMLLTRFGAHVTLAHPEGYRLMEPCLASARLARRRLGRLASATVDSMDEAFEGADAVYPKSWGPYDLMLERVEANRARDASAMGEIEKDALARNAHHRDWICDERRMETHARRRRPLHALPAGRHRRGGLARRHGASTPERGARGELEGLRHHGAAGDRQGARSRPPAGGAVSETKTTTRNELDTRVAELAARYRPLAERFSRRRSASRPTTSTGRKMRAATRAAASRTTRSRGSST